MKYNDPASILSSLATPHNANTTLKLQTNFFFLKINFFKNLKFLNYSQTRPINPVLVKSRNPKVTNAATFTTNFWFKWEKSPKESCAKSKKSCKA